MWLDDKHDDFMGEGFKGRAKDKGIGYMVLEVRKKQRKIEKKLYRL